MFMDHARKAAMLAQGDANWKRNWRDYMIAAHAVTQPYRLVTLNINDFRCLGARAMHPSDFQQGVERGTLR
jgi:predicted nucleic acid-binding protein